MNGRRNYSWLLGTLCKLVLVSLPLAGYVHAQGTIPFTHFAPDGARWWCGPDSCILLSHLVQPGSQERFFLVTRGAGRVEFDLLPGWMSGGEIVWEGTVTAGGMDWDARIVTCEGRRGLFGASGDWSFGAMAPEAEWEQAARMYNLVLREGGESDE